MEAIEQAFRGAFPDWESISPPARAGMLAHAQAVLEANRSVNLTGLREPEKLTRELFAPSWRVGELLDLSGKTVLDLGSGAGFPGIPLALRFPTARVTLAESIGKKAAFLQRCAQTLGTTALRVHAGRAEALLARERFDDVIAQAVGATRELLALLAPHRAHIGHVALMKGKNWERESSLSEERALGFERESVRPIPGGRANDARFLLLFRSRKVMSP